MTKVDDWHTDVEIQWCPGCPNFGILQAFKLAMVELGKQPHELCVVSGIGQAAKFPHYVKANFFNGLHGRVLQAR
jgi:2-oxoglutarate ferredoxin oxidoreductase subunit beta